MSTNNLPVKIKKAHQQYAGELFLLEEFSLFRRSRSQVLEMQVKHLLQLLGIWSRISSRVVIKDDTDFIHPAFQFLDGIFEFSQLVFAVTIEGPLLAPLFAGVSPADRIAPVKPEQD